MFYGPLVLATRALLVHRISLLISYHVVAQIGFNSPSLLRHFTKGLGLPATASMKYRRWLKADNHNLIHTSNSGI